MNNQITFTGTVTQLIEETGISQKTGEPWRRQTVVIEETDVQYPQAIVAQLTRDTLDQVAKDRPSPPTSHSGKPNIMDDTTITYAFGASPP